MGRVAFALGILALLVFSYLTGSVPGFAITYALGLLMVVAYLWPRLTIERIALTRTLNPGNSAVGESFEETFTVARRGLLPAPMIEVRDLGRVPDYHPGGVVSVNRGEVSWIERGVYRRRGWLSFGPTAVIVREPFGLFTETATLRQVNRLLVRPRVVSLPDFSMSAAQHVGNSARTGSWADYPPETSGVRQYEVGDALGRIHWPLSLKHGELMSKTFEQPLTADLVILLDLERKAHVGPVTVSDEETTLETAVTLAASLTMQFHLRGRRVGLVTNDGRGTVLDAHRSARQDRIIMDYLATAEADGQESLAAMLRRDVLRNLPKRALAVITPSSDPDWVSAIHGARDRDSSLMVFYIDGGSFGSSRPHLSFDLGLNIDLYVVRRGQELSSLVRSGDVIRLG